MTLDSLKTIKEADYLYINKKTGQVAYTTRSYMKPGQDGFYKGMQGAWDIETDQLVCRHFDNIFLSLQKRKFERINTEDEFKEYNRDHAISKLLNQTPKERDVYDFSKTDKKKQEQLDSIKAAILSAKKGELTELVRTIFSLSRKGITLEEVEGLL